MMGYSCAPGISNQEVEAALRSLSLREAEDVPVLAIEPQDGGGGRVLFASRIMLSLLGVADLSALSLRIFASGDPGARRLIDLSALLPEDAGPRLERLRFFVGPAAQTFTFLCRKITRAAGDERRTPIFVAAALGARAATLRPAAPVAVDAVPSQAVAVVAREAPVAPRSAPTLDDIRQKLAPRFGAARAIRFLWRTDAEDKLTEITPPLAEIVGAAAADLLGRDFGDVAKYLAFDPDGRLPQAFARRETWSGIEVLWPIAGAAAAVPVGLGGLPAYDGDGHFEGFRGFGVIHLERLAAAEPRRFGAAIEPAPHLAAPAVPSANVVPLRPLALVPKAEQPSEQPVAPAMRPDRVLSSDERKAFEEIAVALTDEERAAASSAAATPVPAAAAVAADTREAALDRATWLTQNGFGANALAILDRLGLGLLASRDDVPIYINRYLLDLLGYADEDAFHAAGGMSGMFERVPAAGSETVNVRRANGEVLAVQARLQTVEWDRLPATLLTVRRDEFNDARAEFDAAMHDRDNDVHELNAILDTATDGLAIIDAQGRILALNRSGEALFGYDQSEVIGQPFTILFTPDSEAKARDYLDGLRGNGVASLMNDGREIVGRPRQGGAIPIFMTLGRIGSAPEPKYCALLRDMTHWKKVEKDLQDARREAERASALKSDFLAKVSHEIRTPLNAILGFAEVILEERFGPIGNERYRDYLKDIHTSGAHVMSLVNDLLDLSKIEAGKMDLAFATVDANHVIAECVSIMQPQANRERVIMRLALAPQLPKVMADERSLRQIILNLLSNAVKFNEPGGQVIIASALTDAGNAVIRIRDTGIGMSEQDIETALEPFRQVATSRQTTGTGLGLPLTKALIEANRAFLTIKSKKNEGTLVEVVFPAARVIPA